MMELKWKPKVVIVIDGYYSDGHSYFGKVYQTLVSADGE